MEEILNLNRSSILMVKSKMDGMEYRYEDNRNILTIYKRIREE